MIQICVSKCPETFWSRQFYRNRNQMICEGDKNGDDPPYKDMVDKFRPHFYIRLIKIFKNNAIFH